MARPSGTALQLSRVGARVSADFAARVGELDLTPTQVGVLRIVGQHPGVSQQELASRMGVAPSRVTKLVDELAEKNLVTRERSITDRRQIRLHVSDAAAERLGRLREVVVAHDAAVVEPLTAGERETLLRLLSKVADGLGLAADEHPGQRG